MLNHSSPDPARSKLVCLEVLMEALTKEAAYGAVGVPDGRPTNFEAPASFGLMLLCFGDDMPDSVPT